MNLIAKLLINSLYGKFGMSPHKTDVQIYDNRIESDMVTLQSVLDASKENLSNFFRVGNFTVIVRGGVVIYDYNDKLDIWHGLDVNIAIASAVTSGARVIRSKVKNNPNFDLYYTDTDSAVINKPLPFKLEYEIDQAVF